ncbi:MAG: hypothetical protein ACXW30_02240 [Micavibrio sp.]
MGHTIKVKTDAYLIHHLAFLSQATGKRNLDDLMIQAIALTAQALQKSSEGYIIQIVQQSIGKDKFGYPIHPIHAFLDMKRRKPTPLTQELTISANAQTMAELDLIAQILKTDSPQDALHFSALFAHTVAKELRKPRGMSYLVYIDAQDRRFGHVAKTPYDKSVRNSFNRWVTGVQDWWNNPAPDDKNPPPKTPPGPHP